MTPSRMSARELTIVQLGGAICMPSIFAGYALVRHYQLAGAITALIIGNAILWYIARIMLKMTMVKRLNTAECVAQILGPIGEKFCALSYVVALTGWFAVNQHAVVAEILMLLNRQDFILKALLLGFFGLINTYCVIQGIKSIESFARYSMPLMMGMMGLLFFQGLQKGNFSISAGCMTFSAILLVINMSIGVVLDIPTYYRFSESYTAGLKSLSALFFVLVPLVEGVGVVLGCMPVDLAGFQWMHQDSAIMNAMFVFFFVFAGMTTNNANLFSLGVNTSSILDSVSAKTRVAIFGSLGTALSFMPILENFEKFIQMMSQCLLIIGVALVMLFIFFGVRSFDLHHDERYGSQVLAVIVSLGVVWAFL